jgi:hypothetical protein
MRLNWSFIISVEIGQASNATSSSRITDGRCRSSCLARETITVHNYSQFVCCGIVSWSLQRQERTSWNKTWSTSTVIRNLLWRWYETMLRSTNYAFIFLTFQSWTLSMNTLAILYCTKSNNTGQLHFWHLWYANGKTDATKSKINVKQIISKT